MKLFLTVIAVATGALLTGCATFTPQEIASVRQRGVSPPVVAKFEHPRVLLPGDIIELSRRHVPDRLILRQLDENGVDYIVHRDTVAQLRTAKVSPVVIDALLQESERFARRFVYESYPSYGSYDPFVYDDFYNGRPYGVYGDIGIGFYGGHHYRHWR